MELDNESASSEKMSLDCRCAMSSAIIKKFVGPEIFCDPKCQVSSEVKYKVICFSNSYSKEFLFEL